MASGEYVGDGRHEFENLFKVSSIVAEDRNMALANQHSQPLAQPAASAPMRTLPNEILSTILTYLDSEQPSVSGLYEEPTSELTNSEVGNLKAACLVSKRWRGAGRPILFKHSRFIVNEPRGIKRPVLSEEIQPFLKFIQHYSLAKVVYSFVLVVHGEKITNNPNGTRQLNGFASFWESLFYIIDPIDLLIIAPGEALGALTSCYVPLGDKWSFDCPYQYLRLQQPSSKAATRKLRSDRNMKATAEPHSDMSAAKQAIDPLNSSLQNPLDHQLESGSHAAEIPRRSDWDKVMSNLPEWEFPRAEFSSLFDIRPWSTLLLNEGSFIKAYSTYEFWLRQHPGILSELLGADEDSPRGTYMSTSIREFSYIAMFPMASHFSSLSKNLPHLERLYVQLVPRNNILDCAEKMEQVVTEELWMERNSCYALLMRELFNAPPVDNYQYLEVFESGDAADRDAWLMALEYVKRAGNGWKVAADGVFTRELKNVLSESVDGDPDEGTSLSVN